MSSNYLKVHMYAVTVVSSGGVYCSYIYSVLNIQHEYADTLNSKGLSRTVFGRLLNDLVREWVKLTESK